MDMFGYTDTGTAVWTASCLRAQVGETERILLDRNWSLHASNVCTKSGQSMNFKNNHDVSYSSHAYRIHIIHTNIYGY